MNNYVCVCVSVCNNLSGKSKHVSLSFQSFGVIIIIDSDKVNTLTHLYPAYASIWIIRYHKIQGNSIKLF